MDTSLLEKYLFPSLAQSNLHGFIRMYFINSLLIFVTVGVKDVSFQVFVEFIKKKKSLRKIY